MDKLIVGPQRRAARRWYSSREAADGTAAKSSKSLMEISGFSEIDFKLCRFRFGMISDAGGV